MRKFFVGALIAVVALVGISSALAAKGNDGVTDRKGDTPRLKKHPELDIRKVAPGVAVGDKLKFKITMQGKVSEKKKNERPFLLINTKGDETSDFEYLVLGPRVFKVVGDGEFKKTGANKFSARNRSWVYRFKPKSIGKPKKFGWAALTAKGNSADLAPNREYEKYKIK